MANSLKKVNGILELILELNKKVKTENGDNQTIQNPLDVQEKDIAEMALMNEMLKVL